MKQNKLIDNHPSREQDAEQNKKNITPPQPPTLPSKIGSTVNQTYILPIVVLYFRSASCTEAAMLHLNAVSQGNENYTKCAVIWISHFPLPGQ